MQNLLIILLLSPFVLHAQTGWIENGRTQTWGGAGYKVTIFIRDSLTGKPLPSITDGYVIAKARQYYENGKLDPSRKTDWSRIVSVLDKNHKQIPWRMFDHYSVQEPGSLKLHEK